MFRKENVMSKNDNNLKIRYLLCLLSIAVFLLCTNATRTQAAAPIGSVEVTQCLQTDEDIKCDEAMIVTVPISFGVSTDMEIVTLSNIPKTDGQGALEEAVQLEITKSAPTLNYPLTYFHTVAYYPHEKVIKVPHPITGCEGCLDCSGATSPTCGWVLSGNKKIPYSQGFCCIKSLFDLEHSGSECWWWRGERLLGEQATMENPFSTAHCLRQGDVYFHGYEIGEYIKSYEIKIKIIQGSEEHTFIIGPKDPLYSTKHDPEYSGTFNMKAELIGDMEPYSGAVELDNYILYIPSAPDTHEMVIDYQNNMLLVPREEVSKDGSEPDKVGVSFKTFRSLGSDYKVSEAGDGLGNQLFHKHNSDLQKLTINPSAETTYLVHGKRDFKRSMNFQAGMEKSLAHRLYEINNSLVSFTIDKATIKHITTESKGVIMFGEVEDFTCMSDDGKLNVLIKNIGDYKTDYIVTVTRGTMNISGWSGHGWAIPAQSRTLQPNDEVKLKFDVTTRGNLDTSNEVFVTLRAPHGKVYDSVWVNFDTKKHASKYSWEFQEKNKASKATLPDDTTPPVITLVGPNTMDLECGVDSYVELGAEAVDDTDPCVVVAIGGDTVDTSTCGPYVVVYLARDASCNISHVTRTVEVVDTTPPVITLNGPNTILLECGVDAYAELGATATDYCDDDVPVVIGGDTVDSSTCGTYVVTYSAQDDSGNIAEATRVVQVQDTTPPVITLNGPATMTLECGVDSYIEEGATAIDNCDDDVPVTIGGDTVDTSTCATYLVTYDATDDSGNAAAQVIRTVIVEAGDTTPPQLAVSVSPDILWPPNHKMVHIICTLTATDDQDESPEVSLVKITMNEGEETKGDGHTIDDIKVLDDGSIYLRAERAGSGIGRVYTITYQAVDDAQNVTQTSATVTVPPKAP